MITTPESLLYYTATI
ncbi:hypothetical protein Tco_0340840, partial [Tanacetum coccineum]